MKTEKGVRQGCILSPCLVNLYAEYIMSAGKSGNPFQTKQGNRPYFRDQEERKVSDEVVPGTLVLSLSESQVTFLVASRVPSTVSHFKTEPGTSLEML